MHTIDLIVDICLKYWYVSTNDLIEDICLKYWYVSTNDLIIDIYLKYRHVYTNDLFVDICLKYRHVHTDDLIVDICLKYRTHYKHFVFYVSSYWCYNLAYSARPFSIFNLTIYLTWLYELAYSALLYGPRSEKTCLRGFWQSKIQTSLLSYRD